MKPRRNHTQIRTRLSYAEAITEFYDVLLPDPDPASMQIAQDLCETYGLKLADLGEQMAKNGFENKCWTETQGWADYDVSSGEFVISEIRSPFRVIMRPPHRGERGWWVSSRSTEGALAELLREADNTEGSLGWLAPEDFGPEPDENDMIAVTVERNREFMAVWWSVYHRPQRKKLHHSVDGPGGGYRIGVGAWYDGRQWDEGKHGVTGVQMTPEQFERLGYLYEGLDDPLLIDKNKRSLPPEAAAFQPLVLRDQYRTLQEARRAATELAWAMAKVLKERKQLGGSAMEVAAYLRELVHLKEYKPPRAIVNPKRLGEAAGSFFSGLGELVTELNPGETAAPGSRLGHDDPPRWAVQYRRGVGGIRYWIHFHGPDRAWVEQQMAQLHPDWEILSVVQVTQNPRANASGNWEVVSTDGGLEGIFAREEDAQMYCQELRGSGALGVKVQRRRQAPAYMSPEQRENPSMSRDDAYVEFHNLLHEPDPEAMKIAEDIVLEHRWTLVDLSRIEARVGSAGIFDISLEMERADHPVDRIEWSVEPITPMRSEYVLERSGFAYGLKFIWKSNGSGSWLRAPSAHGYMNTREAAERAAAADAWACAKQMKRLQYEDHGDVSDPVHRTSAATVNDYLQAVLRRVFIDKTAPEIYEHRSTRAGAPVKNRRTFLEARDDLMTALKRAGWSGSSFTLKVPWTESPNHKIRLWWKPQAVYYSEGVVGRTRGDLLPGSHNLNAARSIGDVDIRTMSSTDFLELLRRHFPQAFEE